MEKSILDLIEEAIKTENEQLILKISSKIELDLVQTKLFLKYFHKFIIISSVLDSNYVNYFGNICLSELREKDEIKDETFAKSIVMFIKEKRKNKSLYYVTLQNESDINLNVIILSQLDYKSYKYDISYNNKLDLKNYLYIFNYICNINDEYALESLSKELIEQQIESPLINRVDLDNIPYKKVLEYSKKYNNRIRYIDLYNFKEFDKLKEILELNKESLVCYPHDKFEYLIPLKNAYIFNFLEMSGIIDDNYDFSKIKYVKKIAFNIDEDQIINFLNKCPNVEELEFYDIGSDYLFKIIKNINCQKIKKITATCDDLEDDYDWVTFFQKMPLLEEISIEEHQTMFWTYNISPIFLAERKRLPFPLLEQLIRNYLNGSPDRDIFLTFDDEFDLFWDYFKDKKDILFRVSRLDGEAASELIDTYFKAVINQHNTVDRLKEGKYLYLIVESPYNNEIFEFIKKNKIKYLFIKGGGNVNLDELIKCNDLKFIFDNSSKTFLFKKNNNLERI